MEIEKVKKDVVERLRRVKAEQGLTVNVIMDMIGYNTWVDALIM